LDQVVVEDEVYDPAVDLAAAEAWAAAVVAEVASLDEDRQSAVGPYPAEAVGPAAVAAVVVVEHGLARAMVQADLDAGIDWDV